ncbi:MAG: hypothetical protein ACRD22_13520 [Terriglobia bacterium]
MNPTLKLLIRSQRLGCFLGIWAVGILLPLYSADRSAPQGPAELQKLIGAESQAVAAVLNNGDAWTDKNRRAQLLSALKEAAILRDPGLAQILIDHIEFSPDFDNPHQPAPEDLHPACWALEQLGAGVIPLLLTNFYAKMDAAAGETLPHSVVMMIWAIVDIYRAGGHGAELARKRLELELSGTKDPKKQAALKRALLFPFLNSNGMADE